MFVQPPVMSTLSDVNFENGMKLASRLDLDSKLDVALSSISDERGESGMSSDISLQDGAFSKVMASIANACEKELASSSSSQRAVIPFSSELNGDYLSSFKIENPTPNDKVAEPKGMAARGNFKDYSAEGTSREPTIDKTSVLYEKALELESYFVKIMTQSMRATLSGQTLVGEESFASKMYKDMMYDELNRTVTKNAGFGLADHIYLQLNRKNS